MRLKIIFIYDKCNINKPPMNNDNGAVFSNHIIVAKTVTNLTVVKSFKPIVTAVKL